MFKRLRMVLGVNAALAQLGISPAEVEPTYRRAMQETALRDGANSKECAAFIWCQLPAEHRARGGQAVIADWLRSRKVRAELVAEAMQAAGLT